MIATLESLRSIDPNGDFTEEELQEASRYRFLVEWSDEDQVYLVEVPELRFKVHADTPDGAVRRAIYIAADVLSILREDGDPVPEPLQLLSKE